MQGLQFLHKAINTDDIDILPESKSEEIIEEITQFWNLKDDFKKHGFLHKRGILVHGPQGTGKTTAVNLTIKEIIKLGGIAVFYSDPSTLTEGLNIIREVEPDRPIVVIIEDIDKSMRYGEEEVLAILDGESQIENVVYVATTNYIEKLPPRIINRPSRFDCVIEIGLPDENIRASYLNNKIKTTIGPDGENLVELTEGFSISHIKELIIGVYCQKKPIIEVVNKLKSMNGEDFEDKEDNYPRDNYPKRNTAMIANKSNDNLDVEKSANLPQWDNDDLDFIRRAIAAESDAINLYENQSEKAKDEKIKNVLLHIAKEEKIHLSELQQLLEIYDNEQKEVKKEAKKDIEEA